MSSKSNEETTQTANRLVEDWHTIVLSDIHMGTKSCKAKYCLEFLSCVDLEHTRNIFLVGDIIDGWDFREFNEAQRRLMDRMLDLSAQGVRIVVLPGNHDELMRRLLPGADENTQLPKDYKRIEDFNDTRSLHVCFNEAAAFEFRRGFVFETQAGKKFAVQHGDQFDDWMKDDKYVIDFMIPGVPANLQLLNRRKTAELVGSLYESSVVRLDGLYVALNPNTKKFHAQKWLKSLGKSAGGFIKKFEKAAVAVPLAFDLDGIICGHIHQPEIRHFYADEDGTHIRKNEPDREAAHELTYMNSGDWKESCAFLYFDKRGQAGITEWLRVRNDFGFHNKSRLAPENRWAYMRPVTNAIAETAETVLKSKKPGRKMRHVEEKIRAAAENGQAQRWDWARHETRSDGQPAQKHNMRVDIHLKTGINNCIPQ